MSTYNFPWTIVVFMQRSIGLDGTAEKVMPYEHHEECRKRLIPSPMPVPYSLRCLVSKYAVAFRLSFSVNA